MLATNKIKQVKNDEKQERKKIEGAQNKVKKYGRR